MERWRRLLVTAGIIEVQRRGPRSVLYTVRAMHDRGRALRVVPSDAKATTGRVATGGGSRVATCGGQKTTREVALQVADTRRLPVALRANAPAPRPAVGPGVADALSDSARRGIIAGMSGAEIEASAPERARRWKRAGDVDKQARLAQQAVELGVA